MPFGPDSHSATVRPLSRAAAWWDRGDMTSMEDQLRPSHPDGPSLVRDYYVDTLNAGRFDRSPTTKR